MTSILATLFGAAAYSGTLPAADMLALRQAEKIAMTLTGQPLPDAMRKDYLAGKIKLENIADILSQDPQFIEYFAQYWARVMNFQQPFNAYDLRTKSQGTVYDLNGT
ncbi:MAG: hypothetical protein H7249_05075 [Chitinophagaceae bacterium]|nr:hypothetical protein [Oligoflexus sp.]